MGDQQIGQIIDQRGVTADLDDGDLITDVVVVAKVVKDDSTVALLLLNSEGTSWVEQLGLLTAANNILADNTFRRTDDD